MADGTVRYKVLTAYKGAAYHGWQKQNNALGIQSVIEKALTRIHKFPTEITAAGRTDAGVHALGQVFHFDGLPQMKPESYEHALNTLLPKDIRILRVEKAEPDFHARFSSRKKEYEYRITFDQKDPFCEETKTVVRRRLNIPAMEEASTVFLGSHDFTSFTHGQIDPMKPRVKTVESIRFEQHGKDLTVTFLGDGFMRYQVRMMMGTLIAVGEGKISRADVKRMLEAKNKEAVRFNAPAQGLYLKKVWYPEDLAAADLESQLLPVDAKTGK